jgi:hypothetical protein
MVGGRVERSLLGTTFISDSAWDAATAVVAIIRFQSDKSRNQTPNRTTKSGKSGKSGKSELWRERINPHLDRDN